MLTMCPECELPVSDKAPTCPHCGFPLIKDAVAKKRKSSRRMRLPNGFGQITEIKGKNLRCPFRAMVTVGKTSTGRPISRLLKPNSYFRTYNEAYEALAEYHKNPYDLEDDLLVEQLYERWSSIYFESLKSQSSVRTVTSAWAYCSSVYPMRVKDIRARHIKGCMEDGMFDGHTASPSTKSRIKSMFNLMLDYALEFELVDRNYARTFVLSEDVINEQETNKNGHITFNEEEMKSLWNNVNKFPYIDVILLQCYSGWRPQELGLIELENVDLENWYFKGGIKTPAGTDRIVPIHPKIRDIVKKIHSEAIMLGSNYLINCTDTQTHRSSLTFTYDKYRARFNKVITYLKLNPEHRPHDPRKHFVTLAKKYKVDEYALKYIVGHTIQDLTEKVYTERDVEWLNDELLKIEA